MSKTFKSAFEWHLRRLHIEENEHGVNVYASDPEWRDRYGIIVAPSDAPALMLAIGECLPPIPEKVLSGSHEVYMSVALNYLGKAVRALEAETAEAEAQAELEAEALELAKAGCEVVGDESVQNLSDMTYKDQRFFLAVAHRAREINKETPND